MERHLRSAREDDPGARWSDAGYWLAWPVALLALFWFRRGWTVRWGTAVLVGFLLSAGAPASAEAAEFRFSDLWLTPDQQGRYWLERDEPLKAAERFEDPIWKGVACYRAGNWEDAILQFARVGTRPRAGSTWATPMRRAGTTRRRSGPTTRLSPVSLAGPRPRRTGPSWPPSSHRPSPSPTREQQGDPHNAPDEIQFDERGKKGQEGEIQQEMLTDEQKAEMWLRRLQVTPADFLRRKFAVQAAEAGE